MSAAESYVQLLLGRWRVLLVMTVLGCIAATVYAFSAPPWYEARLSVVPAEHGEDKNLLAKLPALGGMNPAPAADVQRIRAVLTSTSVADEVIKTFKLRERYGEEHLEHARVALLSHCKTSVDKRSGIVELVCEDKDPQMALAITSKFGEVGNEVFKRISASAAREERRFLETQVSQAKSDVEKASQQLREFQEQHRMVDLPEQAKAVISAMASIQGEIVSKELELSYLKSFSSSTESNVRQLRQQIAVLQTKLRQLETSSDAAAEGSNGGLGSGTGVFFPEAMRVPELRFQLEQLVREQKIKETLFFLMSQRYESARADEARDTSTFQILDYPTLPTYKSRPRRLRIMILGLVVGFAVACASVSVYAALKRSRSSSASAS